MYFIILHYFLAFHLNIFHIFEKENEFLAGGGREGGMAGGGGGSPAWPSPQSELPASSATKVVREAGHTAPDRRQGSAMVLANGW
jgi:hypothetical protein